MDDELHHLLIKGPRSRHRCYSDTDRHHKYNQRGYHQTNNGQGAEEVRGKAITYKQGLQVDKGTNQEIDLVHCHTRVPSMDALGRERGEDAKIGY